MYVAGTTPRSSAAISNLRALCTDFLMGRHELEVVDIYQQPALAADDKIVAVPTLVKTSPGSPRCIIGDLSDRRKLLRALDLSETSQRGET